MPSSSSRDPEMLERVSILCLSLILSIYPLPSPPPFLCPTTLHSTCNVKTVTGAAHIAHSSSFLSHCLCIFGSGSHPVPVFHVADFWRSSFLFTDLTVSPLPVAVLIALCHRCKGRVRVNKLVVLRAYSATRIQACWHRYHTEKWCVIVVCCMTVIGIGA